MMNDRKVTFVTADEAKISAVVADSQLVLPTPFSLQTQGLRRAFKRIPPDCPWNVTHSSILNALTD